MVRAGDNPSGPDYAPKDFASGAGKHPVASRDFVEKRPDFASLKSQD
ncbi:hypothetical protein ACPOL_1760 [Acidisarcina polymorpha]|uniref:Uncharacterized protein n=1 Tax=Acidisarcina polymorpha TaxID=2211140 RepID=A0A2Z5FWG0_9BACT|nr:hypothetical protein ACPOL_1760 [Acidisarcina polymorpha]